MGEEGEWKTYPTAAMTNELRVTDLQPYKKYIFRVFSTNEIGNIKTVKLSNLTKYETSKILREILKSVDWEVLKSVDWVRICYHNSLRHVGGK